MLVISMRTRLFLGIKTSTILIRRGNAVVLAVALAAFSFSASAALTALIVFAALTVLGAAVGAEAVVAAAAVVNNTGLNNNPRWIRRREAPAAAYRGFSSIG